VGVQESPPTAASDFRSQLALARREAGRDVIIARAVPLFENRDYDDISVGVLAAAAQISERTFYRYFDSRDDVLVEYAMQGAARIPSQLAARPSDEPPLQALVLAIAMRDEAAKEHSRAWHAINARLPAKYSFIAESVGRRVRELILPTLRQRLTPSQIANGDDVLLCALAWTITSSIPATSYGASTPGEKLILEAAGRARAAFVEMNSDLVRLSGQQ
jgi:AcrR family transcriptional regulator